MKTSSRRKTKVKPRDELPFGERRKKSAIDDIKDRSNYYDHQFDTMVHKIHQGGFCVLSQSDHVIMTTLGSCIAVCMYDPVVRVGGMNHFLLPEEKGVERKNSYCMRYGNNAMETLINEIMKRGGMKDRLIIKAFGAGNVLTIKANIGEKNQSFLEHYIANEKLELETSDLGGDYPRQVAFFPETGKALVKVLCRSGDRIIVQEEENFRKKIEDKPIDGDIELF